MRLFGFDNKYPYTDFHELNLDWILQQMYQLNLDMKTFVNINTIKYADPLQWSITTQYEQNTLVQDAMGMTYLSKQAVPVGISISNTDYWLKVADFDAFMTNLKAAITPYDEGSSPIATSDRYVDDFVWLNNDLYVVTQDITTGSAYVPGTNCAQISISEALIRIYNAIKSNITAIDEGQSPTATANRSEGDLIWLNGNLYTITANMTAGTAYVPGTNCQQVTIADLLDTSTFVANLEDAINAENEGSSTTATSARSVGDLVWVQDVLYQVTSAMIPGDTYVPGSNVQTIAITDLFATLLTLNDLTIKGDLQYKDPVPGTYYDTVEVKDTQGNSYNVMVQNNNTGMLVPGSGQTQTCRPKLDWYTDGGIGRAVRVRACNFYMNGFRYFGQYYKQGSSLYTDRGGKKFSVGSINSDLEVIDTANFQCWYGVFAIPTGTPNVSKIAFAPILRVMSITGNTLTLGATREKTLSVAMDSSFTNIVGRDVLVITGSSASGEVFNGDVRKVTSNGFNTIGLDDASDIYVDSYILIAPADEYCYIASHYLDTNEFRNRSDSGYQVNSYGVAYDSTYDLGSTLLFKNYNHFSPLACGVVVTCTALTSATGYGSMYMTGGADNSHLIQYASMYKYYQTATSAAYPPASHQVTMRSEQMPIFFDYNEQFYLRCYKDASIGSPAFTVRAEGYFEM